MKNLLSIFLVIILPFCIEQNSVAQDMSAQSGDFETGSTWISGVAPTLQSGFKLATDVTISEGHEVTLGSELRIKSGVMLVVSGKLTVAGLVDFQNGSIILVTATGTLVMQSGENSNNSTDVTIEGSIICTGNFSAGTGSDISGSGTISIYGTASGSGAIFGAPVGCSSCSFTSSGGQESIPTYGVVSGGTYVNVGCPIEPYYGYTYSQTIYTAAELTNAGLTAGSKIVSLIYEYTGTDLSNSSDWDVYIGHTAKEEFADGYDWENIGALSRFAMSCAPSVNTSVSPAEVTITQNMEAFEWDGVRNIVIATDENQSGWGSSSDDFLCASVSLNRSNTNKSDSYNQDPNGPPGGWAMNYVPNLKLLATDIACYSSMPFSMDFESGLTWEGSSCSSSYNWMTSTGSTTSSNTGPSSASVFTSSSGYAYCETSGCFNSEFTLTSNCFDFSSVPKPTVSFEYHAYGASIGTLILQYSLNGNIWSNLWSVSGQQHSSGTEAATGVELIALDIANRENVLLRFHYTSGSSYTGDIAIDNFTIDSQNSWVGNNMDWYDVSNWSAGVVPTAATDAFVSADASASNMPVIMGSDASVRNIELEAGAQMVIGSNVLNVHGNWTNNGDLLMMFSGSSEINFQGSTANTLNGGVQDFQNVRVSNTEGIVLETGTYNIYSSLYPDEGSITTNDRLVIGSNSTATGRIMTMPAQCSTPISYYIGMEDSYGDGWNAATLDVYIDGVLQYNMTGPASGYPSTSATIPINCGSIMTLGFTSGSWDSEITWKVYEGNITGTLLHTQTYSSNSGNSNSNLYAVSAGTQSFVGDVVVQQHLSTAVNGWREMTSGVQDMTLSDLSDDGLYMSGFTGASSTYPSWVSVYSYDETQANGNKDNGWIEATNITNALSPTAANRIYTGTGSYNLVMKGAPGAGDYTYDISYQNSSSAELAAAEDQKGWNFVGNPYPCPISWDAVSKNNIDDAIWIYSAEAGNYGLYVGGAGAGSGTNGVDREIAAHQGVWVHATGSGGRITITESAKVDGSANFVKSDDTMPFFKIGLTNSSNAYMDEVILGQDANATLGLDPDKDGYKLFTTVASAPSLWMVADTTPVSLNRVAVDEDFEIELHYSSAVIGAHKLLFTNPDVMNFNGCLVLEDMELNSYTPISDSLEYIFNSNPLTSAGVRFKLHYYPTSEVTSTNAVCQGSADGSIAVDFGGVPPFSATLTSSASVTTVFNDSVGVFENLTPGSYELEIGGGKGCANEQFQLEIVDPVEIMIAKDVEDVSTASGCDGAIRLEAMGGVSPYTYYINGIEGNELGSLCAGLYDVIVVDANGCSKLISVEVGSPTATSVLDLTAVSFAVYPNPSNGNFTVFSKGQTHLRVYSVTGQVVKDLKFNKSKAIDMTDVESGVYILRDMETGDMTEVVVI